MLLVGIPGRHKDCVTSCYTAHDITYARTYTHRRTHTSNDIIYDYIMSSRKPTNLRYYHQIHYLTSALLLLHLPTLTALLGLCTGVELNESNML